MKKYLLKDIDPNSFFSKTVYLDRGFVITSPEMLFTRDLVKILEKWKFDSVLCDGEPGKEYSGGGGGIAGLFHQLDSEKLEKAQEFYSNFLYFVEELFIRASVSDELEYKVVSEKIKEMIEYIKEERRFLMRIIKNTEPAEDKNYHTSHSVRSTILAIII